MLWEDGWKTPFSQDVLDAVDKLKSVLCSSPVLQFYDVNTPTDLYVDISDHSIGSVLRRCFWSEYWVCVAVNQGWLFELLVIRFTVRTDHSSLRWLLSQDDLTGIRQRWDVVLSQFSMIEIVHIPDKDNIVVDALSRYPQENGPSYEHLVDQEGIVDLDCYHLLSLQSLHARALQVHDFATSTSVSAVEKAAPVHEWAAEQATTSEDVEVEQISRVSMEDLTQAHVEGYASSMISDSVELEDFVAVYQGCTDFNDI